MENTHVPFHQKYRPKNLDELVGQEFISITLKQALLLKKIAPAYLFNGPRGTGKTSSARIFAKSLNCLSFNSPTSKPCGKCELCVQINEGIALDIIEIDAASNTGVENIREIIERARFSPSQARWKVYVIDECHMLSTAASNALLKTIEEPPPRVVFILATTNPERVLETIHSRCQKFDFRRINSSEIFQHLSQIASKESIKFEDQALKLLAKRSNGGMRDAQSLLEQLSLHPEGITTKNVQNLLGEVSELDLINLINSLIENNSVTLLVSCNTLFNSGYEPTQIINGLLNITRDLLLYSVNNKYQDLYYTSSEFINELDKIHKHLKNSRIIDWHNKLKNVEYQIKTSDNPRLWLEIHLTSLLEKEKKVMNSAVAADKKIINNLEFTNKQNFRKQELTDKNNFNDDQNQITSDDLQSKWELILAKLELPSTKMLLSQQAELESVNSEKITIALSPNWENMIKTRKTIIEKAAKEIFGEQIIVNFSSRFVKGNSPNKPLDKKNYEITKTKQNDKIDTPKKLSKEESHDNSTENLAKFFNGEIIDLDE